MTRNARDFGFWRALGSLRVGQLITSEMLTAVVAAVAAGSLAHQYLSIDARLAIAGDYLLLVPALVGVVFAGFALIVGLMSDRYAVWLSHEPDGARAFLTPFLVGVGVQIGCLLASVLYRAAGHNLREPYELLAFVLATGSFVYACLDIVALAKFVLAHGVTRSDAAVIDALQSAIKQSRAAAPRDND